DAEGRVAVVHNGILENADELRAELAADGVELVSDTDTEGLAHLIARSDEAELEDRVRAALRRVVGAYGLAVCDAAAPDQLLVARNGWPGVSRLGGHEITPP